MTNPPPSIPPQTPRKRPSPNGSSDSPRPASNAESSLQRPRELRPRPEIKREPSRKPRGDYRSVAGHARENSADENRRAENPRARATVPPSFQPTRTHTPRKAETGLGSAALRQPPAFVPRGRETAPQPAKPLVTVDSTRQTAHKKTGRLKKIFLGSTVVILALLCGVAAWIYSLWNLADESLKHTTALSGAPNTPGTTYLLAGSDSRENAFFQDETEGRRSDTIMLVHKAENGQVSMVSLPRDSFVNIPGYGEDKLNAAYAYGGPELLVSTVEELTGLTIDNYVEVGMDGVTKVVDSVGGVSLCLDYNVSDPYSTLEWTAGCHTVDGKTALAFARMRYADPEGDIGRAKRQRQVVVNVAKKVLSKETFTSPSQLRKVISVGSSALTVDADTRALDIAYLGLYFREAANSGLTGVPPIASLDYSTYVGSAVLLDPEAAPEFFRKLAAGTLTKTDFWQG